MATKIGINHHYAPPPPFMIGSVVVSIAIIAIAEKFDLVTSPWVAIVVGLFAVGAVVEIIKWIISAIERQGYKTAIEDLELLRSGRAKFREEAPELRCNLLVAAIITMEAKDPS